MLETFLKTNWRTLLFFFVLLWSWLVFPTPFKYYSDKDGDQFRRNRLTGKVECWYGSLNGFYSWNTDNWLAAQKIRKEKEAAAKEGSSEKKDGITNKKPNAEDNSKEILEKGNYSIHANIPTSIRFENKSGKTIKIFWLDYSGNRKLYKVLEKDQAHNQQTYVTHPWLIAGDDDRAMQIYFPDSQPRTVILSQSSTNPQ
jgi:von Hippel-Lindau disease tumor supressor